MRFSTVSTDLIFEDEFERGDTTGLVEHSAVILHPALCNRVDLYGFQKGKKTMVKFRFAISVLIVVLIPIPAFPGCIEVPVDIGSSVHIDSNGGHPLWIPPSEIGGGVLARKLFGPAPEVVLHVPASWDGQSISVDFVAEFFYLTQDLPEPGDEYRVSFEAHDPIDDTLVETLSVLITVPDPWNSAFQVEATWGEVTGVVAGETYVLTLLGDEDPPLTYRDAEARIGGILLCFSQNTL